MSSLPPPGGTALTSQAMKATFWSSVEPPAFQRALLEELNRRGCATSQQYCVSQAENWQAKSRWARLRVKHAAYGWYPMKVGAAFARARGANVDVVSSNTFYAPWIAARMANPSHRVVHWVLDLFPDVLVAAGAIRRGGWIERALLRLMRNTFDRAAANVFLGTQLLRYAQQVHGEIPRTHVIPIGADETPFQSSPPLPQTRNEPVRVLYCGNLGRMHDVETIEQLILGGILAQTELRFRAHGAGYRQLSRLSGAAGGNIDWGGNIPDALWVEEMKAAQVALVTLREGAENLVFPSKAFSALAAGQAIVAVCSEASDLAILVRTHDAGWIVRPGDAEGLKAVFSHIAGSPDELLRKRQNAWHAGQRLYGQNAISAQWDALLRTLEEPKNARQ
jgi:glycosyltransferase involved in cell wall biosynthesis